MSTAKAVVIGGALGSALTAVALPHLTDLGVLLLFISVAAFAAILGFELVRRSEH
jgi:hypothetical protein